MANRASYNRKNYRKPGYMKNASYMKGTAYISGTAVRDYDVVREMELEPAKKVSVRTQKNREKANHMNFGYVLFLTVAMIIASYVLINLIQVRADVTATVKNISALESELNNLKMANDEEYNRIEAGIDLDEIKRIATEELGMVYAREGQVYTYSGEGYDYVSQTSSLHE